jgi:hypothetical protein
MVPLTRERGTQEFYINNVKHGTINKRGTHEFYTNNVNHGTIHKRERNTGVFPLFPSLLLMVPCFTLFI